MEPFFHKMIAEKQRAVGICIPLFSLRTKKAHGVGEFSDLKMLVDWAVQSGISVIQLLPINDTSSHMSWKDSYPYSSLSAFALHPIYLNLEAWGVEYHLEEALTDLDYERVFFYKLKKLEEIFKEQGHDTINSKEFSSFIREELNWLLPYSVFCALRDHYRTSRFTEWEQYQRLSCAELEKLTQPDSPFFYKTQYYQFIQFHLHRQLSVVVAYAKKNNVFFKGDYAVGVNRYSVDTWIKSEQFVLNKSIGAPPDQFNAEGQNWHLPCYDMKQMELNCYQWFCDRLKHLSKYFQIIRIDHVLGYFRFWEIPAKRRGMFGQFNPALPILLKELEEKGIDDIDLLVTPIANPEDVILIKDENVPDAYHFRFNMQQTSCFKLLPEKIKTTLHALYQDYFFHKQEALWQDEAMKKLPYFMQASEMLMCAEDLGFVPSCVDKVLDNLGILELYIQRMPKKAGQRFGLPWEYHYRAVCSPSNHDTSVLRAWWKEDAQTRKEYSLDVLNLENPPEECNPEIIQMILQQHLDSPCMFAIFLLQDLLAIKPIYCKDPEDEQINDPTDNEHYWRFRFNFYLEDLLSDKDLSQKIQFMIKKSHRIYP